MNCEKIENYVVSEYYRDNIHNKTRSRPPKVAGVQGT